MTLKTHDSPRTAMPDKQYPMMNQQANAEELTKQGDPQQPERMQCMEVWGGNGKVQRCFTMPGLRAWITSQPHQSADSGGDVFYLSSCASGRITRLLLADVSGHGAEVSEIAIGLRDLVRRNVNMIQQNRFVEAMNRQFVDFSGSDEFATALVCSFFAPTRTLAICNAGHPCPLIYRQNENRWEVIERRTPDAASISDIPLGILEESAYSHHKIKLGVGDMVLCYSDALSESLDSNGQQLGETGLARLVGEIGGQDPERFIARLFEEILAKNPDNLQQDDVTAILFQSEDTKPRMQDNLASPFRLFRKARINYEL
jgi:sigma-B regulation protein RsbU (phosphoserine phosphatase)